MANEFKHKDIGPEMFRVEWEGIDSHEADSQAAGDILYCDGTLWKRLAKGANGLYLKAGSAPLWQAILEADIPAAIARDAEVAADIATHAAIVAAHHAKYTNANAVTAMGVKGDANPLHHDRAAEWGATEHTEVGNGAPHHAKYTDGEAVDAVEAATEVGDLKAPTAPLAMNTQKITGIGAPANAGDALRKGTALTITEMPANMKIADIAFIIDGGGSAITTGQKGHLEIPFACTITRVTTLADQSGSIVVDIWKDAYANFPPTDADSITASAPPTISGAVKAQDSTLTGWTVAIAAGDILAFNVDSVATVERVLISLRVVRS